MTAHSKKIMVCDDDQGILDVIQMILETEGYQVYTEINSTQLINDLSAHTPDLLILDLWMPILSGDQALKAIRSSRDFADLPVIVLSASTDGSCIAGDAGANDFVAKPFDMDDILFKIRRLLN